MWDEANIRLGIERRGANRTVSSPLVGRGRQQSKKKKKTAKNSRIGKKANGARQGLSRD